MRSPCPEQIFLEFSTYFRLERLFHVSTRNGNPESRFFYVVSSSDFSKLSQRRVPESYGRVLLSGADTGVSYLLLTTSRPGIGELKFRETEE